MDEPIIRGPGDGEQLSLGETHGEIKAAHADTRGRFALVDTVFAPGFQGPPPHRHREMQDCFYVIDGTLVFQVDGRPSRLRRRFPGADAVVFGHSHIPWHEVAGDGFLVLNPGSPTDRRRTPRHSMAEIEVDGGRIAAVAFWAVDDPAGPLDPELVRSGPR